uniref:Reverse transcriptase domain-containing protein n=1 Tax=Cyprinus carpio carpio TaxID=630221 RepID=A0A9J7X4D6_CYPCA
MRRLFHILDFADFHQNTCAFFSLDAEKAFDRLYVGSSAMFWLGEHFISMIKTLYHSSAATVLTGNIISPPFLLQRGTRQGCPLSPLLFCLSLEPLAQAIRKSEAASIKIHDHNHIILLYADDIILYLEHFEISVSDIINEFDNFNGLSGYRINWTKSALMPINNVKFNTYIPPFIPIKNSFTYLGITIYKNIHKIARDHFNNILVKIKSDIQRWNNLKVSFQGKISTIKMNLLPRLNFLFSMLPLSPPPGYFKEINSIVSCFIWNGKCPESNLPRYSILYTQEDWLYQILKCIIGRSNLRLFIIGLTIHKVSWRVIKADKVKPNRL